MSKLLIFVFVILNILSAKAQSPIGDSLPVKQNVANSPSTLLQTNALKLAGGIQFGYFVDTAAANASATKCKYYPNAFISTLSGTWKRNNTASAWVKQASMSDIISIVGCNSLLNGGLVTYSGTGLIFDVSPASYFINCGGIYNSTQTQVTLSVADATHPRVDVIAVNTSGNVIVLTGTPSANPVKPQINGETQLELTHIEVAAGATTPGGVTTLIIYDENTEWTTTSSNVTCNFNNLTNPFHGSKAALATTVSEGSILKFDYGSVDVNLSEYSALKLYIRTEGSTGDYGTFFPKFGYNDAIIGSVTVNNGSYGFESGSDGSYQIVTIPIEDFLLTSNIVNELYIEFGNVGFATCYVDYIQLQGGISSGTSPYITNIFRKTATDSVFMVINNVPVFAFIDSTTVGGGSWELDGNSGTTPGTNFIGTTDDKSFVFKVKDSIAGVIQKRMSGAYSIGSVALGMGALKNSYLSESYANTAIGSGALMEFIGAGGSQGATTAVGRGAGRDNKYGYRNTFIGEYSGFQGWGGDHNTYVGVFSGEVSSGGVFNAGFGGEAMRGQKQGSYNTGAGGYTLYRNTTIVDSVTITNGGSGYTTASCSFSSPEAASPGTSSVVATGTVTLNAGVVTGIVITEHGSGYSNEKSTVTVTITGDGSNAAGTVVLRSSIQNSASGWAAGWQDYSGKNNTYNGAFSGGSIKNYYDEYNTYLGAYSIRNPAVSSSTKIEKGTAIGYNSILSQSNTVIIGDSINAKVGIGTTTPSHKLHVVGDFKLVDGTQGLNKVLTSDANGGASWQTASTPTLQEVFNTEVGGSVLTKNDTIQVGSNSLKLFGSANPLWVSGGTYGVYGVGSGGGATGIYGYVSDETSVGGMFRSHLSSINTVEQVFRVERTTSGTPASGIGASINFNLQTTSSYDYANKLISKWDNATHATRTSHFDITGINNAAEETFANFQPGGIVRVNNLADTLATKAYARSLAGGGGSTNTSVGSGFKVAIDATNNIKSLTGGYGITLDSATSNQVGIKADTATLFPAVRATIPAGGTGNVTKVGTPVDNQIGVWTGDGTLEGDAKLTYNGDQLLVTATSASGGLLNVIPSDNSANYLMAKDATPGGGEPYLKSFHVAGYNVLELSHAAGANAAIRNIGAGGFYIQSAAGQPVILYAASTQILTATGTGVGIETGATSPGTTLDVAGVASVDGLNADRTITAAGTTGNQTINKMAGTVNIAAAGTTVTVTNSLVTANSIVMAVVRTADATAYIKNVVPAAGSFVINLGAAATAEISIGFIVTN